ncbi:MAG: S24/S26 family peptidase [Blastocatellia bacterium]
MNSYELNLKAIQLTANALICDHLRAGRSLCFTMSTSSMRPALAPGDKVLISAALPDQLRPGDIVVRKIADAHIAHRLIGSYTADNEIHLITKGDNALKADDAWQATQLVGKVVAIERAGHKKLTQAKRRAFVIAFLSRCQLSASRIEPEIFRRWAVRILRAWLRVAVWTTE